MSFSSMKTCFATYDKDKDNALDFEEFVDLCHDLFRHDGDGETYHLSIDEKKTFFATFDVNDDQFVDEEEFRLCWEEWIKTIINPRSCLIVVDVQNDFISGTLNMSNCVARQNGVEVIEPINLLLHDCTFDAVVYTYDWHPEDHISFIDNVHLHELHSASKISAGNAKTYDTVVFDGIAPMTQTLWPRHCVQNTWGSELHEDLNVVEGSVKIYKGKDPKIDSYSAFWDNLKFSETRLGAEIRERNVTDVYVCGLAYDVCVGATALDALNLGFRTILVEDCTRGVDLNEIDRTREKILESYGVVVDSNEVKDMVTGVDRRPELGYKMALELKRRGRV